MSAGPDPAKDEEERGAEKQASSMKDQLSKEVASWSKQRREQADGLKQPAPERPSRRSAGNSKKPDAPTVSAKPADTRSRPFSMSYDGQTQAEYSQYLRDRGLR